MIRSMTGFGRCEIAEENQKFTVEIKSVNHRYLDMTIKLPKKLNFFENSIRTLLKNHIERGKVDVFIAYEDCAKNHFSLKYNSALAAQYLEYFREMEREFALPNDITVGMLSRCPEVLSMEEQPPDEKELWTGLKEAVLGATEQLVESRGLEGAHLKSDLLKKLESMLSYVDVIEARSPVLQKEYRERLEEKVRELFENKQFDDTRIITEVILFADKSCVDEETVRLRSHIQNMKDTLLLGGAVGRKLDFIAQEMNREANTILSKANDKEISDLGIHLKTDIEKVREQIQNIE